MYKAILMLLLAVVSNSAMAEWVLIELGLTPGIKNSGIAYYADPTTIRKSGNKVKIWELSNYATFQELGSDEQYMSSKSQCQYDCKEEQYRLLYRAVYSDHMGKGKLIFDANNPSVEWKPIMPDSIVELTWRYACWGRMPDYVEDAMKLQSDE